ncbi:MAG: hypothetical protein ACQEQR_02645, partial [Pseudomonadota bacterium]
LLFVKFYHLPRSELKQQEIAYGKIFNYFIKTAYCENRADLSYKLRVGQKLRSSDDGRSKQTSK